jgi:tetratricopeptide (TPR) repeat protein
VGFLKKPFDLKEAIDFLPRQETSLIDVASPRRNLYQIFNSGKMSVREKRRLIESVDEIHGYDLPFIYSLLVEAKVSGHLNIAAENGDVSGISFSQGQIVGVDIADQETYLGNLLIQSGYILPADLEQVLNVKSNKRLGERLIVGNLLSPHAFNIVLSNQMNIRLSKTIVNSAVKVNFSETEIETTVPNIDSDALVSFLHDWIAGKITLEWLQSHYVQWGSCPLLFGKNYSEDNPALKMPLVASLEGILADLTNGSTINALVESQKFPEEPLLKAIHFLVTKGLLVFGEISKVVNAQDAEKIIRQVHSQILNKNKLDVYDLMVQMTGQPESNSEKVFTNFVTLLGDVESIYLKKMKAEVLIKVKEASDYIKTGSREKLKNEIEKGEIELKLRAASQYEEAKDLLQKSQFIQSLDLLSKALQVDPHLPKSKMYIAWAKLGAMDAKLKKVDLKSVEMDLLQVSPEDKFDSVYIFVSGLYQKQKGDLPGARRSFEKALAIDSSMIVARREINRIVNETTQKKDVLNRDLKEIVSDFFGSKKK